MNIQTQSFPARRVFSFPWPEVSRGTAGRLGHLLATVALAPVQALDWFDRYIAESDARADEQYLAQAVDSVDLERRMRQLDRRRDASFR